MLRRRAALIMNPMTTATHLSPFTATDARPGVLRNAMSILLIGMASIVAVSALHGRPTSPSPAQPAPATTAQAGPPSSEQILSRHAAHTARP